MGHDRWRRQRSATTVGVGPRGPRRPHLVAGVDLNPVVVGVVCCRAHRVRGRARRRAALPAEPDQADPRRRRRVDRSRGVAGTADPRGQRSEPGPSRAVQQVRSAARAEPAAAVWPAPRDPGRPPALHVGRIGDPVGEGRSALDGGPAAAAPPTNQRLGGRAAAGRTRPHRCARPGQIRRRILQRRALRRRLPHRRDPEPSASRHAGVSAGHQHSGSHLAANWRWHCRAAPTRAPCSTRSSTTRPCCRPSTGSATPTVCSRSCAPISLPTCDATSDILLGWLEHRSRPSRRHPTRFG